MGGTARSMVILTPADNIVYGHIATNYGGSNIHRAGTILVFQTDGASGAHTENARLHANGDASFGTTANSGQVYIDQPSTTGAQPVLVLDQADVDEDYMKIIGTSDTSADRALVDAANFTTPGAIVGWLKINVQDDQGSGPITDGDYYIPFYAVPTA